MELSLSKKEIACLILHMHAMRTNIKKVLKSNYGRKEGKKHLKTYDQVKDLLKIHFQQLENEGEKEKNAIITFGETHIKMLFSFVCIYLDKLDTFLEEAKSKDENQEQIEILKQIKEKLEAQENIAYA